MYRQLISSLCIAVFSLTACQIPIATYTPKIKTYTNHKIGKYESVTIGSQIVRIDPVREMSQYGVAREYNPPGVGIQQDKMMMQYAGTLVHVVAEAEKSAYILASTDCENGLTGIHILPSGVLSEGYLLMETTVAPYVRATGRS